MRTMMTLALAALLATSAWAAPSGDYTIDNLSLGEHWYGEDLTVGDLKGRVVLIEFWGKN